MARIGEGEVLLNLTCIPLTRFCCNCLQLMKEISERGEGKGEGGKRRREEGGEKKRVSE